MSAALRVRPALLGLVGSVLFLSAGQLSAQPSTHLEVKESHSSVKRVAGYLDQTELPDSVMLLDPPPAADSAAFARDEEARRAAGQLKGSARWALAKQDADLVFPRPAQNYSCALGVQIDQESTPVIYQMMRRLLPDAGLSTYGAKNKYQRVRPFDLHNEDTCTPADEEFLRNDGSYPSGHAAAGWAWALVLAQISPERSNELLARGLSFGQSRVICNVHWQSDVEAGRVIGAAAVARVQSEEAFQADILAARLELAQAKVASNGQALNCAEPF